eukprot:ANDGO_02413.mRNA.1 Peptide transporter family 1
MTQEGSEAAEPVPSSDGKMPSQIYYIFSMEICERACYYALRAILLLYLIDSLGFGQEQAMSIYHGFIAIAYLSAIPGGIISDAKWGKFYTIFRLSIVYLVGSFTLAFTAIPGITGNPPHWWGCMLGLLLIAIGTGGIKPCVSAMGADQFDSSQTVLLERFFLFFYASINFGSTVSMFVTPLIRENASYAAAFFFPVLLLTVSISIFYSGKRKYVMAPPSGSILLNVVALVRYAIVQRWKAFRSGSSAASSSNSAVSRKHWLDYAQDKFSDDLISAVRTCFDVSAVLCTTICYWMVYDSSSSLFVLQALEMDLSLGSVSVTADQVPLLNPFFILVFVPIVDYIIYPFLRKRGMKLLPLNRMAVGMFLAVVSFVIGGLLQVKIDSDGHGNVNIMWQIPQWFVLTMSEILVSVSGLEFSYSEAPTIMKSVMSAMWLLYVAIGNMLLVAFAGSSVFEGKHAVEFFFYAIMMFLVACLFLVLARWYLGKSVLSKFMPAGKRTENEVEMDSLENEPLNNGDELNVD